MNRIFLISLILGCCYFALTIDSYAGGGIGMDCTAGECQGNEDACLACGDSDDCFWDGIEEECRNPGACCFEENPDEGGGPVLTCGTATVEQCDIELQGEYQGDGTQCELITCGEEEPPAGPTVIVPTMNQWGIIFASIVLGAIGIVAIIREKNLGRYMDK